MDNGRISLLLVDDEPFQRRVLREALKSAGFKRIIEAESGQDAILKITEDAFDVVLSDVQMPGINGLELLRQIRSGRTQNPRDTRFLILTSFSNTEVLGAAMALDVNGFLVKPIKIGVVLEKIERAVKESFRLKPQAEYESVVTNLSSLDRSTRSSSVVQTRRTAGTDQQTSDRADSQNRLPLEQLRDGMRVARDLVTVDGRVLVRGGTILTDLIINRVRELESVLSDDSAYIMDSPGGS
jgi:YesN/AraC family two-component response regulator